jgi:hypothetical protein
VKRVLLVLLAPLAQLVLLDKQEQQVKPELLEQRVKQVQQELLVQQV